MQTYLNNPQLKADFLAEIGKHEDHDAFLKGTYGQMNGSFRGCAIGCSLHSLNILQGKVGWALMDQTDNHARYEAELGLPTWFAYLEDNIFENLPDALAITWPRRLAEAIPVGAIVDDRVLARILGWVLTDADFGVRFSTDRDDVRGWIDAVTAYIDADSQGLATDEQREAAARAARAARAAWAAWDAWAARAARAARAAWDSWDAWAAWDARDAKKADAFFPALSEYVLTLVRALPVSDTAGFQARGPQ